MRSFLNPLLAIIVTLSAGLSATFAQTPVELGKVDWGRDFEAAKKKSAATGKPIFAQFQEVPG